MTSSRTGLRSSSRTGAELRAAALAVLLVLCPALAAPASEEYRLGAGDVVDLRVWREDDISGKHTLDDSGRMRHVLLGEVEALGLTCDELAERLREQLERDYLREARVTVSLVASARRRAWVLGAVESPGRYDVVDDSRVLDLVFAAGGPSEASDGRATLYRMGEPEPGDTPPSLEDREPLARFEIDLAALLAGELSGNDVVAPGDVLVMSGSDGSTSQPAHVRRVRVVGEVARPGSYPLREAATALDAVLAAGGFTEYASPNRVRLVRGEGASRSVQQLRLGDLVEGEEGAPNVALRDGDLLVVPESFF